jgi:translation initiation factor 1A
MPKNLRGGKHKHHKKTVKTEEKRALFLKEEGQEYANVIKTLGNRRLEVNCFDGEKRLAHIRGNFKGQIFIGDIILVSLREYQDKKADVIHKYTADEARKLKTMGELPESVVISDKIGEETVEDEIPFEFESI